MGRKNWHHVIDKAVEEEKGLSQEEIEWPNEWLKKND
jgi:hypothetical protein